MEQKKYGLILTKKEKKGSKIINRNSVFQDDSSEEEYSASAVNKAIIKESKRSVLKKSTQLEIEKALSQDPTVFDYDGVYDQMEHHKLEKKEKRKAKNAEDKKPKYMTNLLKAAEQRKRDHERKLEKKVQKERDAEKGQFDDSESFVTSAYLKKMKEMQEEEDKERRRDAIEETLDVKKQGDMSGFYRHIYKQKMGDGDNNVQVKQEPVDNNIKNTDVKPPVSNVRDDNDDSNSSSSSDSHADSDDQRKRKQLRKRSRSQEEGRHNGHSSSKRSPERSGSPARQRKAARQRSDRRRSRSASRGQRGERSRDKRDRSRDKRDRSRDRSRSSRERANRDRHDSRDHRSSRGERHRSRDRSPRDNTKRERSKRDRSSRDRSQRDRTKRDHGSSHDKHTRSDSKPKDQRSSPKEDSGVQPEAGVSPQVNKDSSSPPDGSSKVTEKEVSVESRYAKRTTGAKLDDARLRYLMRKQELQAAVSKE